KGANLFEANLIGANITNAIFDEANLSNVIWVDGKKCSLGSVGNCD
ncbi:MAG: pentapeptide repeat-containing protein, partial [Alphaproteobacteria bacterium]|nr:pentapeptide repeat-containing protein [Alphaproteobacteria bacterium]